MYKKLSGMTGTALTEAPEFMHIYGLDVMEIPTNKTMIRLEAPDVIYRTVDDKWKAIVDEISEHNATGRPLLVGTVSIEKSEHLSTLLRRKNIKHVVLNAKYHEQEASIIAQAGRLGSVTIATNMAGRGVDILLGGNPEFMARESMKRAGIDPQKTPVDESILEKALVEASKTTQADHEKVISLGGLHVLGTERHEARRIDNQLRGRAGRQGDPGSSRFYLSLEDDLMRIFGSERISGLMARIGMSEGVPIEHNMVSKAIERAQKQVEGQNFSIRKHLLEYDDVMNKQRESIYKQRKEILAGKDLKEYFQELVEGIVDWLMDTSANKDQSPDEWDKEALKKAVFAQFGLNIETIGIDWEAVSHEEVREKIISALEEAYRNKENILGPERMREFERMILLQVIDSQWKDHLLEMDHLKEGIGLRGYGQRDPLIEYKKEGYDMFQAMMDRVEEDALRYIYLIQPVVEEAPIERKQQPLFYQKPQEKSSGGGSFRQAARSTIPSKRRK
jgi:preprotein translocase subunit SecA